jgi:hypothetical protein
MMTLVEGPVGGAAFQMQMIIPQNMLAMMIMAAGGVKIQLLEISRISSMRLKCSPVSNSPS